MKNVSRVKEQSSTTGLSNYDLASSGALYRRFRDEIATGERVRYIAASAADWEEGIGVLTTGTPDVLSRDTILRSSTGAKINWPSGTRDVFLDPLPGTAPVQAKSGAYTVTFTDNGSLIRFTGSVGATFTLPAVAAVGDGFSFLACNDGTASAVLTLDGNGAETIDGATTLALQPGQHVFVICSGSAWHTNQNTINALIEDTAPDLANDFVESWDASAGVPKKVKASRFGKLIQEVVTSTSLRVTCSTLIPIDDTIPQNTEGTEVFTVAITPTNASNILEIEAILMGYATPASATAAAALFKDSDAGAIAAALLAGASGDVAHFSATLLHRQTAGSTSAQTFKIRAGASTGTVYINGNGSNRLFGGVGYSYIKVRELAP